MEAEAIAVAMNLVITPEAEEALSRLAENKRADYVRIAAAQTCGCGSIGYRMHWEEERSPNDAVVEARGLALLVDPDSQPHLDGGIIDYKKSELSEGFFISNPNAPQGGCGCGGH